MLLHGVHKVRTQCTHSAAFHRDMFGSAPENLLPPPETGPRSLPELDGWFLEGCFCFLEVFWMFAFYS